MLQQVTEVEIKCSTCGNKERFDVSDLGDLVYLDDIILEIGWAVLDIGYVCPECWGN